jgi:Right handed beta helix region
MGRLISVTRLWVVCGAAVAFSLVFASDSILAAPLARPESRAGSRALVVPTVYPTIQSAVDAARPGDEIRVRPGTYREQVSIGKSISITGSGAGSTTIRAPNVLAVDEDGGSSIVEILGGASVAMTRLTVSGPGSGTCANGPLQAGIRVIGGGHLDLSFARVTHIHDTPIAHCSHSGVGVLVGDFPAGTGSATIRFSEVSDYQAKGILVLSEGAPTTISHNVVTGPSEVSTDGIDVLFAAATVTQNIVSGNACRASDPECGPDFFNQFQHIGIYAGGPGTLVTRNRLFGNQIGIYAIESAQIAHNIISGNDYFGMALQDGSFIESHDLVTGGVGGVAVVAASANTLAALHGVKIANTSGPPVQKFECCGFTATTN